MPDARQSTALHDDQPRVTGEGALPNLLIIGAVKAGTSSLHYYLGQHPEIFMSARKEIEFFTRDDFASFIDAYKAYFPSSARVRGEASPRYSQHPVFPDVPERIRSLIPDVKLIYLVRDPIDRIVVHWAHQYSFRVEDRPLHEVLRDHEDPGNSYVSASRYATQLERYLEHFPSSSLLVIDQRDLLLHRRDVLLRVFEFLSVDRQFSSRGFEHELNTQSDQTGRLSDKGLRLRESPVWDAARRVPERLRAPLARRLRSSLSRNVDRPALDPALRRRLEALLKDEADRLRTLSGQSFSHWSI